MAEDKYIVSARKYRPSTFKSVVGQKNLTHTLKNAIDTGRLAQAYLFCGPRGVGKTSCARIFAKTINCLNPTADGEACGECESCRSIDNGTSFNLLELDAASNNGINDMRSLIEQVNTPPQIGKYRVFIIDEVHMLSTAAFNAFLKTLEEPPEYAIFILATTEKHKVLPTILSRCQIYDFKRITVSDIAEHLEYVGQSEGIETEPAALSVIARKADGGMRDALSIFDQVAASSSGKVTYEATIENLNILDYEYYFRLVDAFRQGDVEQSMLIYASVREKGFDSLFFVNGLATHIRDLMLAASPTTLPLLEQGEEISAKYAAQAVTLPAPWYYAALRLLSDCDLNYRLSTEKRLLVELTLIRLCQLLKPTPPPFDSVDSSPALRPIVPSASAPNVTQPAPQNSPGTTTAKPTATPPAASRPKPTPISRPVAMHSANTQSFRLNKPESSPKKVQEVSESSTEKSADVSQSTNFSAGASAPSTSSSLTTNTASQRDFSDDEMADAWIEFTVDHPELQILTAAMRSNSPRRISATEFEVVTDHSGNLIEYEKHARLLSEFLRSRLGNNRITLSFKVDSTINTEKLLSPKEFLGHIITENPDLGAFLKEIDAEVV